MEITRLHPILLIILVILLALIRYGFEKMVSRIFKSIPIERTGVQLFTRGLLLIFFNMSVLALFSLLQGRLFAFAKPRTGMIILAVGLGLGIIVALLSLLAIKAGFGGGYNSLASISSLDKSLTLATFILLAGPSEDIFFIGFAQNVLTPSLGWGAIMVYLVLFVAYHYANVISGVEKKQEFFGMLPVRLMVSLLLSLSFYLTGTLMYGAIVHNLIDTLSYVVLLYAVRQKQAQISSP
ncbi:MAG: CPBP family glutamic-type intramembrane protease [Anaerolineales bacterium]|jgi:membrane protease YdiL (CAAX protease family)|nr:CPBP family glutamic-type intramembrane protease [Anaerolineales bacterium]